MATIKRLIEKQNELLTQAVAEIKSMALTLEEQRAAVVSLDEAVKKRSEDMYKIFRVQCEVIRGIIFGTGLNEGDKLDKAIDAGNEAVMNVSELKSEIKSEADLFNEAGAEPKPKRKKAVAPSPEMRQLRSWAKHYGWTQREFRWGMVMCEIIGKDGGDDIGTCWLTPEEAQTINERLKGFTR